MLAQIPQDCVRRQYNTARADNIRLLAQTIQYSMCRKYNTACADNATVRVQAIQYCLCRQYNNAAADSTILPGQSVVGRSGRAKGSVKQSQGITFLHHTSHGDTVAKGPTFSTRSTTRQAERRISTQSCKQPLQQGNLP